MLSGNSIRRLISQRRIQNEYEDGALAGTDRPDHKGMQKNIGTTKRRPYTNKKRSPPPIIVSREQSIHDILNPLPPLPAYETPRTSDSSLNSYERHHEFHHEVRSKRSRSPLCSISSKEDRSQESLQLSSATSYGADEFPPKPPPKGHTRSSESLKRQAEFSGSNVDLIEALSLQTGNKESPTKRHLRRQDSLSSLTDNIQQLIQEADEAFRAVGSALADVQISENQFKESQFKELPRLPTPDPSPILKPAPLISQNRMPTPQPPALALTPSIRLPRRSIPATSSIKRKKSKKSKKVKPVKPMKPYRKPAIPKSAAKSGPRWTLSDNVTDLFSGKFFHKIEVDEMLSPSQVEAYRLRRMSIMQSEKSTETLDTESSDTPVEPFHLDDLPSRIGSAGVNVNEDASTEKTPIAPTFEPVVRQDFALEERKEENDAVELSAASSQMDIGEAPMQYKNATFPTPPLRHAARFAARSQRTALPSIPESSVASAPPKVDLPGQNFEGSRNIVANSNYVFLQSAPCSITSPRFRHGPIRLAKSDLIPDMKVGADEGLDWTAFQMAISGGAGDWLSESDDTIRRKEAEEVDELVDWFGSLNFKSTGGLVTQDFEMPSPTSTTSGEDYSDVSYTEIERDNPYSPHHQWQRLRRKAAAEGRQLDLDMSGLELDTSKMRFDDEGKEYDCRESYASLPQSPMLDLRVIRTPDGDDMDVVPMGYNLGHDLGDFLKWEAEHAYAGDFFST
ncbi:hypothetical protein F4820DRAFT_312295 [Hypoxylon rubiginosum]|uniref:Uncharacterized protein n=1 Tax=Hypoxylon rubiginosum TaxID=110542 RepID=A0ACB9Z1M5_9PEZI|nr:hypothetical protein F4820DRAFT_312295 [Hypoxylon rubiginosum]